MTRPTFVWHPDYEMDIGRHVFPTSKFRLVKEALVALGLIEEKEVVIPRPAPRDELLAALDPDYLAALEAGIHSMATVRSELPLTPAIARGSFTTAGGTIHCVREALRTGLACHLGGGFHHGFADHAEGFCYVNDIAVAVAVARREGWVDRVAVVDTDVHQGNGTAAIFSRNPSVYTFSIHQEALYPYNKERSTLDIGLPADPGQDVYLEQLTRGLELAIGQHKPQLVIHAAGVDPYEGDQLGDLKLTARTLRERDRMVARACFDRNIPLVTVTAGGYARNLQDTVGLHVQTIDVTMKEKIKGTPHGNPGAPHPG